MYARAAGAGNVTRNNVSASVRCVTQNLRSAMLRKPRQNISREHQSSRATSARMRPNGARMRLTDKRGPKKAFGVANRSSKR